MRLFKAILFLLLVGIAVELSFRVYMYGPSSLNPVVMNSMTQIHDSGFLKAADVPEVKYELRPNIDTIYKGMSFQTNSAGMRDDEYTLEKPAGTFRIVVLGSSWTMGSGVGNDDIWHAQLENKLNSESSDVRYEFLNLAVDQYGLGEMLATLEHKGLAYDPDLILVAVTHWTPLVPWDKPPKTYTPKPRRYAMFNLHSLRMADLALGTQWFVESDKPDLLRDMDRFRQQMLDAGQILADITRTRGTPVMLVKLGYQRPWTKQTSNAVLESFAEPYPEIHYYETLDAVTSSGYSSAEMAVSKWDSHPNPLAHGLIADVIRAEMERKQLLGQKSL